MRRPPAIDVGPLLGAIARTGDDGPVVERILDAAAAVLAAQGLRRGTVEDIADAGRLGRTTVYRRFDGRDEIVVAVLGREVRRTLTAIAASVDASDPVEDQLVEGMLAGIGAFRSSPLLSLVRTEPELLALVTTEAGPMIAMAAGVLVDLWRRATGGRPTARTRHVAEAVVRLSVSLALAPSAAFDVDDPRAARRALHAIVDPLVGPRR